MQALKTISVKDAECTPAYYPGMFTHDEIRAELVRQIEAGQTTQAAVARRLNIPAPRVSEMRNGTRRIQPDEMPALVAFLGMTSEYEAEIHTFVSKLTLEQQRLVRDMVEQLAKGETQAS